MTKAIGNIILCALFLLLGVRIGEQRVNVAPAKVQIDTSRFQLPLPIRTEPLSVAKVSIPRFFFAPGDTVTIEVPIERYEYADSTYRMQISGPSIGDYRPHVDWIETYNKTITQVRFAPYKWEIGPAAGAWYANSGGSVWVGGQVRRNFGRLNLTATGGWDPNNGGAFVQATAGLTLWRK
ncbi:DUF6808 domain-containing protein [uncultured Alistipes sp.]|jgi:hypothetical protein|uniref:DUF6808 domain-containing protein n=1 Tax=uncultured Alistipes sp. TaxID=538949 RepID=UPI0025DBD4D2|nr:hypothetical protein [uncultured Alistipes sp.]